MKQMEEEHKMPDLNLYVGREMSYQEYGKLIRGEVLKMESDDDNIIYIFNTKDGIRIPISARGVSRVRVMPVNGPKAIIVPVDSSQRVRERIAS